MNDLKNIVDKERVGLWAVAACVLAIISLILTLVSIKQNKELAYVTQAEMLMINKKINALESNTSKLDKP